jgi:hypothetical protein
MMATPAAARLCRRDQHLLRPRHCSCGSLRTPIRSARAARECADHLCHALAHPSS